MPQSKKSLADRLRNEWQTQADGPASKLENVFEEEPPTLDVFVRDKRYFRQGEMALGVHQYDFVRHFEQVLHPETYIAMVEEFGAYWEPVRYVNELTAEWGKGGGKDHVCQIGFGRVANILLCLKDPQAYYAKPPQMIIHMLNVAVSSQQAHGVFFKPLRSLIVESPFFKDKFEGDEPGPVATEIRFKKRIELISGHSSAEGLEGKNLIAAAADELGAFPTVSESRTNRSGRTPAKTAEGIIEMLQSSATTRFPFHYKLAKISYPRFKGDAIQKALAEAQEDIAENGENSVFYASGPYKTWDVNPLYDSIPRIELPGAGEPVPNVPKIVSDYRKRPAYARAKYECAPELSANPVFENVTAITEAFSTPRAEEPVTFEYYWGVDDADQWSKNEAGELKEKPGWQVRFHFAPDFYPMRGAMYAIHGDMAISGDAAGVAMCHVRNWERRDWEGPNGTVTEARPIVKVDFVTSFTSDHTALSPTGENVPREVQIRWYRKLVWELIRRGFTVTTVTFDRFQSADTMQILQSRGIESKRLSTDTNNAAWETLRDVMYDGRLEAYHVPTTLENGEVGNGSKVVRELRELSYLPNGRADHRPDGSKDEADALAGAVVGATLTGGDETDTPERADLGGADLFSVPTARGAADWGLEGGVGLDASEFGAGRYAY